MDRAEYEILETLIVNSSPVSECGISAVKTGFRVLDVLDYFERHDAPVGTRELGRALSIPSSSMDEILKAMASRGYLSFDLKSKTYTPSYKIVEMGRSISDSYFRHDPILPVMRKITEETGLTSVVTMLEGYRMHSISFVEGEWGLPGIRGKGARRHLFVSGPNGWHAANAFAAALLAPLPNALIVDLAVRSAYSQNISANSLSVREAVVEVDKARKDGYAWNRSQWVDNIHMVAAPVNSAFCPNRLAVGVVGSNIFDRHTPSEIGKTVLKALSDKLYQHSQSN